MYRPCNSGRGITTIPRSPEIELYQKTMFYNSKHSIEVGLGVGVGGGGWIRPSLGRNIFNSPWLIDRFLFFFHKLKPEPIKKGTLVLVFPLYERPPPFAKDLQKPAWGDFSLFCLDSMRSTISAKSSQLCRDKVSLNDRPWMSSYIMQCVSWLWNVFWPSSDYFPGELKWRWAIYSILQVWSARNSNTAWWFRTNC
jgi:hypothetical protein